MPKSWPVEGMTDNNVHEVTVTRDNARAYFDGEPLGDDFELALDTAQGAAESDGPQFVVIKITA